VKKVSIEVGCADEEKDIMPESSRKEDSGLEGGRKELWDPARCAVS
jgi:hypothetical protein